MNEKKNFIKKFKDLDRANKGVLILSFIVTILLLINIMISVGYIIDYGKSKESGNCKWRMFASMMEDYDKRIKVLEDKIHILENNL